MINRKPYDQKVDMWSIGVTAYLLLCGKTPFNGENRQQLFQRIYCDDPTFPDDKWGHISDEAIDFIKKLLTKDPGKRLSATEALGHRWMTDSERNKSKTPSYDKVVDSSEKLSELTDPSKQSRDPPDLPNDHSNNATPKSPDLESSVPRTSSSSWRSTTSEDDDKARLLEVIKEQDAKIERLERMVMRMMEPGDEIHKC